LSGVTLEAYRGAVVFTGDLEAHTDTIVMSRTGYTATTHIMKYKVGNTIKSITKAPGTQTFNDHSAVGSGNDVLADGAGDDTLVGQGGADRFVFADDSASDTVKDFVQGQDKIDLVAFMTDFDSLMIDGTTMPGQTTIGVTGMGIKSITLEAFDNNMATPLVAGDFVF
jgi:hypothetical protein